MAVISVCGLGQGDTPRSVVPEHGRLIGSFVSQRRDGYIWSLEPKLLRSRAQLWIIGFEPLPKGGKATYPAEQAGGTAHLICLAGLGRSAGEHSTLLLGELTPAQRACCPWLIRPGGLAWARLTAPTKWDLNQAACSASLSSWQSRLPLGIVFM